MNKTTILILANKYPNFIEPNVNVFTQQITWSFVDQGYNCIVICPVAINYNKNNFKIPFKRIEITKSGKEIAIFHPKYVGLGQNKNFFLKSRVAATTNEYISAVERVLKEIDISDTIFFAEFLCPAGVAASILGKKYNIPSYMQCGESTYEGNNRYGNKALANKWLKDLTGVIAVSGHNKNALLNAGVISEDKIIVLPSGYRKDRIFKRDKVESRIKLGLPLNKFIVGFCGSYGERKGVLRLQQAIDNIEDLDIVLAAVGKGKGAPTSEKCIMQGPLNHEDLAWFYSAIDIFAFPTYNEGCCTAIVEAIACGCPIISSDRAFNYEICDDTNSILIEPDDIDTMSSNIIKLKNDDELRKRLSEGSLEKAKGLSLDDKAKKVLDYMLGT